MNYPSSLAFLSSLTNYEAKLDRLDQNDFSLDRFRSFLELIGNPQKRLRCVHIAGSKGKGSTALFTAEILRRSGYRTGLYTSPHLYDIRERIRILSPADDAASDDGFPGCIDESAFCALTQRLKEIMEAGRIPLTYFEFLTALAFVYFDEVKADAVVLETGLGGRLDATNVVDATVCGITRIDLEHTRILGGTLERIASEKAGIIQPGCRTVVCGTQSAQAAAVIRARARICGAAFLFVGEDILVEEAAGAEDRLCFRVRYADEVYECATRLLGEFQAVNAAVAIGLAGSLAADGLLITRSAVERAVAGAVWPGRMEIASRDPLVVVDGAHTEASCRAAVEALARHFPQRKAVVILGISADKDLSAIVRPFAEIARAVIFTRSRHPRAADLSAAGLDKRLLEKGMAVVHARDAEEALKAALDLRAGNDMIVAAGSLFLVAEIRQIMAGQQNGWDKKRGRHEKA